jgi:hypothetical protein
MLGGVLDEYARILQEIVDDYAELALGNPFPPNAGLGIELDQTYRHHGCHYNSPLWRLKRAE